MSTKENTIFWFRRDLRLDDNRGLYEACQMSESVIPIFIFDSKILSKLKNKKDQRVSFIFDAIQDLKKSLSAINSKLVVLYGDPVKLLPEIANELNAINVVTNEDYDLYSKKRDQKISNLLTKNGVDFYSYKDHVIFSGSELLKKDGTPYRVYTPYKNEWLKRIEDGDLCDYRANYKNLKVIKKLKIKSVNSLKDIGFVSTPTELAAGTEQALDQFNNFLKKIDRYHLDRDFISVNGTSLMATYLRFGLISIRKIVRAVMYLETEGAHTWLLEIIWREFYNMILDQFPHVENDSFLEKYSNLKWPGSKKNYQSWVEGRTGFPIIDAAMRCFNETGMMHNRLRMIVASFLVKDLLVDWRKGEEYFAQLLMDYDLAANNGGWQWCASTGCDAQPYFRIFNPTSQSEKFDPDGEFIKKWVPEVSQFPRKFIHNPSKAPINVQQECRCIIGKDYPHPIVDHSVQRKIALDLYKG